MTVKRVWLVTTIVNFLAIFICILTLPNSVPVQIAIDLKVVKYGSKWLSPLLCALSPVFASLVLYFEPLPEKVGEKFSYISKLIIVFLTSVLTYLSWFICYVATCNTPIGAKIPFPISLTIGFPLSFCLIAFAFFLKNCKYGGTKGIKTQWTMGSKETWELTHKIAFYLTLIAGFIVLVCGVCDIFIPISYIMLCCGIGVSIILTTIPYFITKLIYKKVKQKETKQENI